MKTFSLHQYFLSTLFIFLSGLIHAQTGTGSSTLDNGYRASASTDSTFEYAETLYIGPGAVWEIDGIHVVYSKFIWIAPEAQITGNGKLIIANPDENPFYTDMAGFTIIDGNNGNFIELDIVHGNPNNVMFRDIDDPGFGSVNPSGSLSAAFKVGKNFDFSVNDGDVILLGSDFIFDYNATLSNYSVNRMVVTSNNIAGHIVKENASFVNFVFPVGIAEGDYTPVTISGTNTYHVSVTNYASSSATILVPEEGMDRSWHIFGGTAASVSLQHNSPATDGSSYVDASAFITQYQGSALWSTTNSVDFISTGLHSQAGIPVPAAETAQTAWFTKTSDRVTPLACTPAIACPTDIIVNTDLNLCSAVVTWAPPIVTDTCAGAIITSTHASGSTFPVGVTTVVYTVSDSLGYADTCSFTVTVIDAEAPVITCATDLIVSADLGSCAYTVSGNVLDPVVSDLCGAVTLTHNYPLWPFAHTLAGASFPVGTTTVLWTAIDSSGNTATCSVNITVNDTEAPTFVNCVGLDTIILALFPGVCEGGSVWPIPFATDNCSGLTITQAAGPAMGSILPVGNYPIAYVATDAAGNTDTCAFVFSIIDSKVPTIVCPTNTLQVENTPGTCGWISPVGALSPLLAQSNCSSNITWSVTNPDGSIAAGTNDVSGYTFGVGTSTVTYTIIETASGQTASCSFTVVVTDNEAPVFVGCPSDVIVPNTVGTCEAIATWVDPTFTDNCPDGTIVSSHTSGSTFPVGSTTVTYTATDAAGNITICSFVVEVQDNDIPVFTGCPTDMTVTATAGSCNAVANWIAPVATDNCSGVVAVSTHNPGATFPIGVTTVTYTATDANGNSTDCSFTVTVTDTEAPIITCTTDMTVSAAIGSCTYTVSGNALDPVASDLCSAVTLTHNYSAWPVANTLAGANFPLGTTTVLWTATDSSGNTATCSVNITVNDTEAPSFVNCIGLDTITLALFPGVCEGGSVWPIPFATDNCSGVTITQAIGPAIGSILPVGNYPIAYVATDAAGNTDTCAFVFSVIDSEVPTIVCPTNILQVENTPGTCGWVSGAGSLSPLLAQANCAGNVTWSVTNPDGSIITGTNDVSGYTFGVGTSTVTYTLTETSSGQSSSCSFTVIVVDAEAPVFAGCPTDLVVSNTAGTCGAAVTWVDPIATDNCPNVVITSSHTSGASFPVGTTTVTYTATDASGNTTTCSFDVTVEDTEVPVITCPVDVTVAVVAGNCNAAATWTTPTVSDNCGVTLTSTHNSGDSFPIGVTTVTYTATDAAGNSVDCSFTVTVTGSNNPVITNCPGDITVAAAFNTCLSQVYWPTIVATDNCSSAGVTITSTHPSGYLFPVGTTPVVVTATDSDGNITTCSFNVTVEDNQAPMFFSCTSNKVIGNQVGTCGAAVFWDMPNAFDNCSGVIYTSTHNSGDTFPLGVTTVTLTATDASGNAVNCTFTVTVNDTEAPVIAGLPANMTIQASGGQCSATASWTEPTATDNCNLVSFVATPANGTVFPAGTTTVTYTATDASGNVSTGSFTVTVVDSEAPTTINCPTDIVASATTGDCAGTATWTPPTFTDNCSSVVTVTSSHNPGDTFPIGVTTVTYTATDSFGNTATCTFDVTIEDNELPTVTNCPSDIISCSEYITWVPPVFADNCTHNLSIVSNYTPGANFPVGTTTVVYTATDASGNVVTCSFDVTRSAIYLTPVSTLAGCNGASTATATVTIAGGVGPYTFNWGVNGTDSLLTGLEPGIYTVTVTDAAGCSATASIEIGKYVPIDIVTTSTKNASCGYADGSISTTTTGGIEPYSFLWNNEATTANINNLTAGTYHVVVTDGNGCTDSLSVSLSCEFEIIPQLVTPNGDGHNDVWEVPGLENYTEAVVEIYNRWGNLVYKASPYLNDWAGYSERTTDVGSGKLPAGTYFYVIQLKSGEKAITGYLELQY